MRSIVSSLLVASAVCGALAVIARAETPAEKSNVLLIVGDDIGFGGLCVDLW